MATPRVMHENISKTNALQTIVGNQICGTGWRSHATSRDPQTVLLVEGKSVLLRLAQIESALLQLKKLDLLSNSDGECVGT
jgi:hypothetical protein